MIEWCVGAIMATMGVGIEGSGIKGARVDIDKGDLLQDCIRIPTPSPGDLEQVLEIIDA
jgi:polyphosphate glucokinase